MMIRRRLAFDRIGVFLACLIALLCCGANLLAQDHAGPSAGANLTLHATHVLGLEGIPKNARGDLLVQDDSLRFQISGGPCAEITFRSIHDVVLGEQDKRTGRSAGADTGAKTPFGDVRALLSYARRKNDTVTVHYVDSNRCLHGAVFRLTKGEAQALRSALEMQGARVNPADDTK